MTAHAQFLFDEILQTHLSEKTLAEKYSAMRKILESALRLITSKQEIQFPDLYSKLTYVTDLLKFSSREQFGIQNMRKNAHLIILNKFTPDEYTYYRDLSALTYSVAKITEATIPVNLLTIVQSPPLPESKPASKKTESEHLNLIRFYVLKVSEGEILGRADQYPEDYLNAIYDPKNSPFKESLSYVKPGQVMHLINCQKEGNKVTPELFILEPDYLLDISSVAECFKSYGTHPYNYFMSRITSKEITVPILLGNIANHFLDIFVNLPKDSTAKFKDTMKEVFKLFPFDISVNTALDDRAHLLRLFDDAERQFNHIKHVVQEVLPQQNIPLEQAVLEPSFFCPQLGIQGRLDFLSIRPENTTVIELKSGKAPFPESNTSLVGINHSVQLFLYQIVIQMVLGIKFKHINSYLLYSKYNDPKSNLRMVRPYMEKIKEILDLRNQIVFIERSVSENEDLFEKIISDISPKVLINAGGQNEKFIQNYIIPQIEAFKQPFVHAGELEKAYFYSFYSFVSKELYITKAGVSHYDQALGHSGIWLNEADVKIDAGDILWDLQITENLSDTERPVIRLSIPEYNADFLPNFRQGDIAILYPRNHAGDNVSNKQIFRGSIIEINHEEVVLLLRYRQNNTHFLPNDSLYAIEHDFLESSYRAMFMGLYTFLEANQDRKDLLLNQRVLRISNQVQLNRPCEIPEIQQIVEKAKKAEDYFLLIGPPGTGKTSIALKSMVDEFYSEPQTNILLLAYTNRAVDEICESISQIQPEIEYIRIGSEFSTEKKFQHRLLQNVIKPFSKRNEVKNTLQNCRVYVGTVASVSGKSALFKLKKFDVAIVDEASQILEPQIIGILTAKHPDNAHAIKKFILIGDHKQLPAIVVQSPKASIVRHPKLLDIGITDRRISLFERLYRYHEKDKHSPHWSMLKKQGRMHAQIAEFSNKEFYGGELQVVPVTHQRKSLEWNITDSKDFLQKIAATERLVFFASKKTDSDQSFKVNSFEAELIAKLLENIHYLYQTHQTEFNPKTSVGIITPYRSQIALIRKKVLELNLPELNEITIDTVERYQGSQRDIILYSFCVNHENQLELLSNTFIENGISIDRKLNVALTRARKQLFITGNPYFLEKNVIFSKMTEHIRKYGIYIESERLNKSGTRL